MTENKKPEWFELTDGSAPSAQVAKVNKLLPVTAALIAGAVIATGAFFANASQSDSQVQEIAQSAASAQSVSASPSTPASDVVSTPTFNGASSTTVPADPAQGGVAKPGANRGGEEDEDGDGHEWYNIFGGDDDHDEYDDDDDNHDDDDDHEGRDRHERD